MQRTARRKGRNGGSINRSLWIRPFRFFCCFRAFLFDARGDALDLGRRSIEEDQSDISSRRAQVREKLCPRSGGELVACLELENQRVLDEVIQPVGTHLLVAE